MRTIITLAIFAIACPAFAQYSQPVMQNRIFEGEPELIGWERRPIYQRPQFERVITKVPRQVKEWVQVEKTVFDNVETIRRITPRPLIQLPTLPEQNLSWPDVPVVPEFPAVPAVPDFPEIAPREPAIGWTPMRGILRAVCSGGS